ncbi:alpha/beta hydrolase [Winogradskya consettensis]|uniref:Alpha/beta hydrolase n=1 Tax=Winogradskya consettensis TaxID=113560 RepID=A0A919SRG6_9ACTN|nr:alpha/beta hydrolase [Actinoplanes consettensis]GIM76985.1 alpha/beta hydrolase [Actinoplanes consettensis]
MRPAGFAPGSPTGGLFRHSHVAVGASTLHVVEAGPADGQVFLLVHGWPQSWFSWRGVMAAGAAAGARMVAFDLPGVGESTGDATDGTKRSLAEVVHGLIGALGLHRPVLAGHDCGGMIGWSYLQTYDDVAAVAILDTVVPGIDPWNDVLANPYLWHFAFHSIPGLPETMVTGRERPYFDYFFDVLSPDPARITDDARQAAVAAYSTPESLAAGFSWYRQLHADAANNTPQPATSGPAPSGPDVGPASDIALDARRVGTPLLYVRGEKEGGDLDRYVAGFRAAGVDDVRGVRIPRAGHFTLEEEPAEVWAVLSSFGGR